MTRKNGALSPANVIGILYTVHFSTTEQIVTASPANVCRLQPDIQSTTGCSTFCNIVHRNIYDPTPGSPGGNRKRKHVTAAPTFDRRCNIQGCHACSELHCRGSGLCSVENEAMQRERWREGEDLVWVGRKKEAVTAHSAFIASMQRQTNPGFQVDCAAPFPVEWIVEIEREPSITHNISTNPWNISGNCCSFIILMFIYPRYLGWFPPMTSC